MLLAGWEGRLRVKSSVVRQSKIYKVTLESDRVKEQSYFKLLYASAFSSPVKVIPLK